MSKINGLRDYLLENYVDSWGNLDIRFLDFSDFDGDVVISNMKVKGNLYQNDHNVQSDLSQGGHKVGGRLWQSDITVQGDYDCAGVKVGGKIYKKEPTKILKKITRKELTEMGYEVID